MVRGNSMAGKMFNMIVLKKLLRPIMMKKPIPTPKQNGIVFAKPCCLAKTIAIKLLGPGVKLVMMINNKKENTGKTIPSFKLCDIMHEIDFITSVFLLYKTCVILYMQGGLLDGRNSSRLCEKFKGNSRKGEIKLRESFSA